MISSHTPSTAVAEAHGEVATLQASQGQIRLILHGRRYVRAVLSLRRALEESGVVRILSLTGNTDDTVTILVEVIKSFDVESFLSGLPGVLKVRDLDSNPDSATPTVEVTLGDLESRSSQLCDPLGVSPRW